MELWEQTPEAQLTLGPQSQASVTEAGKSQRARESHQGPRNPGCHVALEEESWPTLRPVEGCEDLVSLPAFFGVHAMVLWFPCFKKLNAGETTAFPSKKGVRKKGKKGLTSAQHFAFPSTGPTCLGRVGPEAQLCPWL